MEDVVPWRAVAFAEAAQRGGQKKVALPPDSCAFCGFFAIFEDADPSLYQDLGLERIFFSALSVCESERAD